jgi:pimeloyl-ACP methyl ester carboxylesterase
MAGTLPAGPFGTLPLAGRNVPFYVVPFDKDGILQAPATATRLVADIAQDANDVVSDVIVVVHGWNTDFNGALTLSRNFVGRLDALIGTHGSPRAGLQPMVVGIFWPSILLPSSTAPAMAAVPSDDVELDGLTTLGQDVVAPEHRAEFYELVQSGDLDRDAALRLADLLAPLYAGADDDLPTAGGSDPAGTVAAWLEAQARLADAEGPLVIAGPTGPTAPDGPRTPGTSAAGPQAAGLLDVLDPRNVVRLATVLLMKDRAGAVGFRGVGPLLSRILAARDDVRVHLIGHSYGCKASLSAVCSGLPRKVRSVFLMQPALSYLALSNSVPKLGKPGGYAAAKQQSELPIMATWSQHDIPLRDLFALAVRRRDDLGEQNIGAAGRENPPSLFAAMGGWGPQPAADIADIDILSPDGGVRYALDGGERVLAVNGTTAISGHSDVTNVATAWALYSLMAG